MGKKKYIRSLWLVFQIALGILTLYWISWWSGISWDQLVNRATHINLLPLFLGILLFSFVALLNALRYSLFFGEGISVQYLAGLYLFQNALITFIPWRLGELSYPILLYKDHGIRATKSLAVLLLIRFVDFLIIMFIVLFSGYSVSIPTKWIWILCGVAFVTIFLLYLVNWGFNKTSIYKLFHTIKTAIEPIFKPRAIILLIIFSAMLIVVMTLQTWLILEAVSFKMEYLQVMVFNAISLFAALLPIHPPGGWGTMDSIQSIVIGNMGYDLRAGVSSILVAHSIYLVIISLGGISGWLLRKTIPEK